MAMPIPTRRLLFIYFLFLCFLIFYLYSRILKVQHRERFVYDNQLHDSGFQHSLNYRFLPLLRLLICISRIRYEALN